MVLLHPRDRKMFFFHGSKIVDHGFFGLKNNDRVSFEVRDTQNGRQAVNVKVIG